MIRTSTVTGVTNIILSLTFTFPVRNIIIVVVVTIIVVIAAAVVVGMMIVTR